MKRTTPLSPFIVCALLAAAATGAPQADSGPLPDRQVNERADPCVRLRAGAALDRPILDCLEPGTRLRLLGAISGWSRVRLTDGSEGWMDSAYLEVAPAAAPAAPAAPPAEADGPDDLRRQITALEGQLKAAADRREASEERLRKTIRAAEAAQSEVSRLRLQVEQLQAGAGDAERAALEQQLGAARTRVAELEGELAAAQERLSRAASLNAEQERRIEALDASVAAAAADRARLEQALAAAQDRQRAAEQATAEQAERLRQLEVDLPTARDREAELRQGLAAAEARQRAAEEESARQAERIAQLEARPASDPQRQAELERQLGEAQSQLREAREANSQLTGQVAQLEARPSQPAATDRSAEMARQIDALRAELADAERRVAEAELKSRLAARPQPAGDAPAEGPVTVRPPIVAAPQPPRVPVRAPVAAAVSQEEPRPETKSPSEAAIETVRAWAAAWSNQQVEDYLSFYAPDFRPADGLDRAAWEARRRERLRRPAYIRVTISGLSAESAGDGAVRATFGQEYESDTFSDRVSKILTLVERDGRWLILTERATP